MLRVLLLLFQLAGGLPSDDPEGSRVFDGDPVDLATGLYEYSNTDWTAAVLGQTGSG